ncbi:SIR2 family protein [Epilithonimonas hominis]|nr:SIR2 family protein [Epilithonimonas hominis]
MFREFQKKLLEPHTVIFVIGYSFSDEHVNNIIYQALATNTTINLVIINSVTDSSVAKINDNRIFKIYGKDTSGNNIHYFNYIVKNLMPDIDMFKDENIMLNEFIKQLKK